MVPLRVIMDGDGCWSDLTEKGFKWGRITEIARLPRGTTSGKPSVTVRIELDDGRIVLGETTLALLGGAIDAMRAQDE